MRYKILLSIPEGMVLKFKNLISNINKLDYSEEKIIIEKISNDDNNSIVAKPKK